MTEEKPLSKDQIHLVETHLNLAHRIALDYWRRAPETMEKTEVVAIAYQGLLTAALRFDTTWRPENDPKYEAFLAFGAFARRRISGAIMDWQRSRDHVPRRQRRDYKSLQQSGHGSGRTAEELADITGLNVEKIRSITQAVESSAISLDAPPAQWDDNPFTSGAPSSTSVEDSALVSTIQDLVADTINSLPPLQRSVVTLRYYAGYDLTQIATELGVGVSAVRVSHKEAVDLIHAAMRNAAT